MFVFSNELFVLIYNLGFKSIWALFNECSSIPEYVDAPSLYIIVFNRKCA